MSGFVQGELPAGLASAQDARPHAIAPTHGTAMSGFVQGELPAGLASAQDARQNAIARALAVANRSAVFASCGE